MNYVAYPKQNLIDIAVQKYGSVEGLIQLLKDNKGIEVDTILRPAQKLVVSESDNKIANYFKNKRILVATGVREAGFLLRKDGTELLTKNQRKIHYYS